jgi:hypothetical protein
MRKGIALIVALVLSLVAMVFIGALFYLLTSGTQISGMYKTYTSSLEVAKGISNYLMRLMDNGDFCKFTSCNSTNATIDLGNYSRIDNFQVNATLLYRILENPTDPVNSPQTYAVELKVVNENNPSDKTTVDFVYRIH